MSMLGAASVHSYEHQHVPQVLQGIPSPQLTSAQIRWYESYAALEQSQGAKKMNTALSFTQDFPYNVYYWHVEMFLFTGSCFFVLGILALAFSIWGDLERKMK